jgi:hypothetical protein
MNYTESSEVRGSHISTTVLEFSEKFQCSAEDFYRAMTVVEVRVKERNSEASRCKGPVQKPVLLSRYSDGAMGRRTRDQHSESQQVETHFTSLQCLEWQWGLPSGWCRWCSSSVEPTTHMHQELGPECVKLALHTTLHYHAIELK